MLEVRGQQVLLDRDVAELYGVETKAVNQAVKRNAERFYDGYILTLTAEECSRSQIVTLNGTRGSNIKYLPHAFTEKGLYMLATISASSSTPYAGSGRWVATLAAMKPRRSGRDFRVG